MNSTTAGYVVVSDFWQCTI